MFCNSMLMRWRFSKSRRCWIRSLAFIGSDPASASGSGSGFGAGTLGKPESQDFVLPTVSSPPASSSRSCWLLLCSFPDVSILLARLRSTDCPPPSSEPPLVPSTSKSFWEFPLSGEPRVSESRRGVTSDDWGDSSPSDRSKGPEDLRLRSRGDKTLPFASTRSCSELVADPIKGDSVPSLEYESTLRRMLSSPTFPISPDSSFLRFDPCERFVDARDDRINDDFFSSRGPTHALIVRSISFSFVLFRFSRLIRMDATRFFFCSLGDDGSDADPDNRRARLGLDVILEGSFLGSVPPPGAPPPTMDLSETIEAPMCVPDW
mmetsp:Transcript_12025/g.33892  ORF Transcript_12025/g.33892 Transcript_12025/m.33892 type:complete len:320 (-) Transcript_12025:1424-2383(-)